MRIANAKQALMLLKNRLPQDAQITEGETSMIKGVWIFTVVITEFGRTAGYIYYVHDNGLIEQADGNTLAWRKAELLRVRMRDEVEVHYQHTEIGGLDVFRVVLHGLSYFVVVDDYDMISIGEGYEHILERLLRE